LHPLLEEATELEAALERYKKEYVIRYPKMMRSKLGLIHHKEGDNRFAQELEEVFVLTETDMTIFFRNLAKISKTMSVEQLIIDKADQGDYSLLNDIHALLKQPYKEQPEYEQWFSKRPEWARHKVGCSMLSCSS